ncbi:MAG: AEC family transporter [Lachnospiraceae bacterium]
MDNIIFSANVVLPLLILMALGYFVRHKGLLDGKSVSQCNGLVFKLFLPVLLFNNVRNSSVEELGAIDLFIFVFIVALSNFIIATIVIMIIEKENPKRGVMIQGIARSNYAIFGIPLVTLLLPDGNVAVASILIAIVIPLYNVASVIVLTCFGTKNANMKQVFLAILKNPLIIATALGMVALFLDISFPSFIETSITNVASVATPFSLFLLGASFELKSVESDFKRILITVLGRLVISPAVALTLGAFWGFRGVELACIMVIFGSPTAVSSFPMAETMGGDGKLAASIVVFTSTFCIFSIFAIIVILKTLQLI